MRSLAFLALASFLVACGDDGPSSPEGPFALFKLYPESTAEFYDLPFPSDLRRDEDGTISLAHFPDPSPRILVPDYIAAAEALSAFGTTTVTYFRFSESVDASTLPATVDEAMGSDATVFLMDVDPASPTVGQRHPAVVVYQDTPTKYWASQTVGIRPVIGRPLAWGTKYAAVVTRGVQPATSERFARDVDFDAILGSGGSAAVTEARALYEGPLAIVESAGVARDEILSMTVFTTQDDFVLLEQARDFVLDHVDEPQLVGTPTYQSENANYVLVEGYYDSPTFQHGTLPYSSISDGGAFMWDQDGNPILADTFDQRFALSIPTSEMLVEGYPLVLYAHGTTGSAYSPMNDGTAANLAARGIAVMGIDQLHHDPRVPGISDEATQIAVYNVINPQAFRFNALQAALDVVQQARMAVTLEIPAEVAGRAEPVYFDPEKIYFMGHSQGGQNGPLFLAIDDAAKGGMLSGAGAQFTLALLEKVEPLNIPEILAGALFLPGATTEEKLANENVSPEHPILNLLQSWMDVADPVNYAHRFFRDPRPGFAPKHIFMTEGIDDSYTPPPSIEALAIAAGIPLLQPVLVPIEEMARVGEVPVCPPVSENAESSVTAGLSQYLSTDVGASDGHFVTFREPARSQVGGFFETMVAGAPVIPAGHDCAP
jgi:hypothetical protein